VDARHAYERIAATLLARGRYGGDVPRLDAEVELIAKGRREAAGELDDVQSASVDPVDRRLHAEAAGPPRFDRGREAEHDVGIALDHRHDPGPLHLDDDLLARAQTGCVDLRDRGCRQRLAVETRERLLKGAPAPRPRREGRRPWRTAIAVISE
jgi:hypothetical protein